jgi:putative redox protein
MNVPFSQELFAGLLYNAHNVETFERSMGAYTMAEVIVHSLGNLRQEIDAGSHTFYADEPVGAGGDNAGPNPYELLLAALGACTSMTLLLYARRKGWPLEDVQVRLSHQRDYARDCADCEAKPVRIDQIERRIALKGDLDQAQRTRLLEIAEKCPVHRTLTGTIRVSDTLE